MPGEAWESYSSEGSAPSTMRIAARICLRGCSGFAHICPRMSSAKFQTVESQAATVLKEALAWSRSVSVPACQTLLPCLVMGPILSPLPTTGKLCPAKSQTSHRVRCCRLGRRLPSSGFCALCPVLAKMPAPSTLPTKHTECSGLAIYLLNEFICHSKCHCWPG